MLEKLVKNAQVTSVFAALGLLLFIASVESQNYINVCVGMFCFLIFVPITVRNLQRN
jgi:hypothetical protein